MTPHRPVWAEVNLTAIAANIGALRAAVAPAEVLAVVKADAYGHGAIEVSKSVLAAGASGLGVALVEEGVQLREAGIDAPILVLSEPVSGAADAVVEFGLTPVVYTPLGVESLAKAVAAAGAQPVGVHLKVDTGMHRVGCRAEDAVELAVQVVSHPELDLAGTCTHFAVADEPDNPYSRQQIERFTEVVAALRAAGVNPGRLHACNTAGALALPDARYDVVRAGIGIYGIAPSLALAGLVALEPALTVKARVSFVKTVAPGTRISYGLRYETDRESRIATVPIGYADGVPRALGHAGASALVRGVRCRMAGTVTMDQLMLDVGDVPVEPGDEVVLLGRQGSEVITAEEWAALVGTIPYEVVCGIGPRVPRTYIR